MQVGEVRVAEDADFQKLKTLCTCHDGWKQDYNKHGTLVWTKTSDVSDFKLIKVQTLMKDIAASTLYDVLHDPEYRRTWDAHMLESYELCCLNPNNDIGYYACHLHPLQVENCDSNSRLVVDEDDNVKTPKGLKKRDFVLQRSWLDMGTEYFIINHSVNHTSIPPRKGYIRGISYITGYFIVPSTPGRGDMQGLTITYVTQSDPKGKLPAWAVNRLTRIMAPKVMKNIHKACLKYEPWKAEHQPTLKPWLYPEQMTLPRFSPTDIRSMNDAQQEEVIDETEITEDDVDLNYTGEAVDSDSDSTE